MTFALTGEPLQCGFNDIQVINFDMLHGVLNTASQTTTFETGSRGHQATLTSNSNAGCVPWGRITNPAEIAVYTMYMGCTGSPSQDVGLFTLSVAAPSTTNHRFMRLNTDRTISFYDKSGLPIYHLDKSIVVPTSGGIKVTLVINDVTLTGGVSGNGPVFVSMAVDGDWKMGFDTGLTRAQLFDTGGSYDYVFYGEKLGANNPGISLYGDNGIALSSSTATDSPHITAYPNWLIHEPLTPDAEGTTRQWTNESAGTGGFASVDEAPNDGTTTFWQSTTANHKHLVECNSGYSFGGGTVSNHVQLYSVEKLTGGAKSGPLMLLNLGGTETTPSVIGTPTTSYLGTISNLTSSRPGGGDWTSSDFAANTLEWGVQSSAVTPGAQVTIAPGPAVAYYASTLPLGPTPVQRARWF